jgi:hypothetical protein
MLNQVRGQKVIRKTEVFFIFLNNFLKFAIICLVLIPLQILFFLRIFLYAKLLR